MNNNETMKVCGKGHYYQGDSCPYCPKLYDKETRLYPVAGSVNIPLCPHCGKPLRKRENINQPYIGQTVGSVGNPGDGMIPWNYEWNGRCDNCGHEFNINMVQNIQCTDLGNKHTSVKIMEKSYMYHITAGADDVSGITLSGIEIESYVGGYAGDKEKQKIFLSTNELKYLLKVLSNSPILQQEDYEWITDNRT